MQILGYRLINIQHVRFGHSAYFIHMIIEFFCSNPIRGATRSQLATPLGKRGTTHKTDNETGRAIPAEFITEHCTFLDLTTNLLRGPKPPDYCRWHYERGESVMGRRPSFVCTPLISKFLWGGGESSLARTFQLYGGGPNTTPQNGLDIALAGSSVHICVLFLRFIRSLVVQGL